jgi:hypothetical protein
VAAMDERLEYPLPILFVDTDNLLIETQDSTEGRLHIKNTGGALLSGHVVSRSACIAFEPAEWEGNDVTVTYRFDPQASGMKPGEVLETTAFVCSNGGEAEISVTVKLIKMAIPTAEGITVANIRDFFRYALDFPIQARRLFTTGEFYMLLLATGYPYMEAYEMLHRDTNRERAMDNFFILSGLKQNTVISVPQKALEFMRKPYNSDMIHGQFLVHKSDGGYVEIPVSTRHGAPWLKLPSNRIITSDFNEAETAVVSFTIDPLKINGRYARETVLAGTEAVDVVFKRAVPLSFRLNREAYRFEDAGHIEIVNHTGSEIWADVFCKDSCVRFAAKKFPVGERCEIPFDIKLSTFMSAQLLFRKLPFMRTGIEVKMIYRDRLIKRNLEFVIGKL